jgi:sugar/nucleoside kinase (ribokinase family)
MPLLPSMAAGLAGADVSGAYTFSTRDRLCSHPAHQIGPAVNPVSPLAGRSRVLVVGDVMTDVICLPEGPVEPGSDRRATIRIAPGGSGANQANWLAAFGLDVRFAARVGAADRAPLTAAFAALGVEVRLAGDPDLPSGTLVTLVSTDGERSFLTDRGANARLTAADLPETLLEGCALLVVSGYALFEPGPRAAVGRLLGAARAAELPVAIDPASVGFLREVGPALFLAATAGATTLFANEAEALALSGAAALADALPRLVAHYPRIVVKRGAAGALIARATGPLLEKPAPQVAVRDTTGAGDAFAAAFIAAELGGADEAAALDRAITAGSAAVTRIGGRPPIVSA